MEKRKQKRFEKKQFFMDSFLSIENKPLEDSKSLNSKETIQNSSIIFMGLFLFFLFQLLFDWSSFLKEKELTVD